jgi:hypothetical protein
MANQIVQANELEILPEAENDFNFYFFGFSFRIVVCFARDSAI